MSYTNYKIIELLIAISKLKGPPSSTNTTVTTTPRPEGCGFPQWVGDNFCDDENNNEECGWDGGDCCGNNVVTQYCTICACLDPNGIVPNTTSPNTPITSSTVFPPDITTTSSNSTDCGSPQWFGDNYCDDENNNELCGWDGGDCCGKDVVTTFCSACECLDPNGASPNTTAPPNICEYDPYLLGNQICNNFTNTEVCNWDGGDCCGTNVNKTSCTIGCECLDPNWSLNITTPDPFTPPSSCGSPQYFGDDSCDDENNNAACGWDGGDCCGNTVNVEYCLTCQCLDPNGIVPTTNTPSNSTTMSLCRSPQYIGDGYCDDNNNIWLCDWDGGDCCGENVLTNYCVACECLDPKEITDCENPELKGDNHCDDETNNESCNWDGGDCCGDNVNVVYCTECKCLDPNSGTKSEF